MNGRVIKEDALIEELFDKPYTLDDVTDRFENQSEHMKQFGITQFRAHRAKETGDIYMSMYKDGATEIHHMDKDFNVGSVTKKTNMANRYFSTMISMANSHLSRGHSVRIVGTVDMISPYHNIAKSLSHRQGREVSELVDHPDESGVGKPLKSFMIHPSKNPVMENIAKILKSIYKEDQE